MATIRNLPALVRTQFKAAQESGDLTFFATKVSILHCGGLPFQLRFSPALANKPKSNKPANSKPVDPFENPPENLFITSVLPDHFLVLNKFPVVPNHFILATKEFKQQTDLLEKDDLGAAYACLKAYKDGGEELFGFFNSGEASGASQPHRHIQFLPVESMRSGIPEHGRWDVLADSLTKTPRPVLPFTYFASPLPKDPTPEHLHELYTSLLKKACLVTRTSAGSDQARKLAREADIMYNLALTDQTIVLCPRLSEGFEIKTSNGDVVGHVSLNGTLLGGTLLVKSEQEWDALRNDENRLKDVLQAIGVPSITTHDKEEKL